MSLLKKIISTTPSQQAHLNLLNGVKGEAFHETKEGLRLIHPEITEEELNKLTELYISKIKKITK